jgi:type IV secretion system protein VirD4
MVSRQETPQPLLTPGEVMQLPADDELVMISGCPPIRTKKARYYLDRRFKALVVTPASLQGMPARSRPDDWSSLPRRHALAVRFLAQQTDSANGGRRREPELAEQPSAGTATPAPASAKEFDLDNSGGSAARQVRALSRQMLGTAQRAALDPDDGMGM